MVIVQLQKFPDTRETTGMSLKSLLWQIAALSCCLSTCFSIYFMAGCASPWGELWIGHHALTAFGEGGHM